MACFELYQLFGTIITRLLISRSGYRRRVVRTSPRTRAQCSLRSVPCFVRRNNERARTTSSNRMMIVAPLDASAPTYVHTYVCTYPCIYFSSFFFLLAFRQTCAPYFSSKKKEKKKKWKCYTGTFRTHKKRPERVLGSALLTIKIEIKM